MVDGMENLLQLNNLPQLERGTLVLAFSGWMDGGDVSTGTVERLVDLLTARPIGQIDSESFYIYNFPGSMEISALFRPHIEIEDGLVRSIEMPTNTFYCHRPARLVLFVGKEPNLRWRTFGDCIFRFVQLAGLKRIVFVGSFGGSVPHTREPRLYVTCSNADMLAEMERYGVRRTGYAGPGSFTSYLMTRAPASGVEMASLVAEIPGYLHGSNPSSIEAVTRRLAKILQLPLELDELRTASTQWELEVSNALEQNEELSERVRRMEEEYDNELINRHVEED